MSIHGGAATYNKEASTFAGAHDVDQHFRNAPFEDNIAVMLGLMGVWNITFLGYPALAILPYTQALSKLAPHIQQARLLSSCMATLSAKRGGNWHVTYSSGHKPCARLMQNPGA